MLYDVHTINEHAEKVISARDLQVGELAESIGASSSSNREIVLCTKHNVILLQDPSCSWPRDADLKLRRLVPGTVVQLKVTAK
jgi:hypothetical protein